MAWQWKSKSFMLYYHMELNFYYDVNKSLFKSASIFGGPG